MLCFKVMLPKFSACLLFGVNLKNVTVPSHKSSHCFNPAQTGIISSGKDNFKQSYSYSVYFLYMKGEVSVVCLLIEKHRNKGKYV